MAEILVMLDFRSALIRNYQVLFAVETLRVVFIGDMIELSDLDDELKYQKLKQK